jgi:hypothetical protein
VKECLVGVGGYPVEQRLSGCGGCVHVDGVELASGFGNDLTADEKSWEFGSSRAMKRIASGV